VFPGSKETLHWPFDDPATAKGSSDEQLQVFRRVRDEIASRIRAFLDASIVAEGFVATCLAVARLRRSL